MKKAFFAAVVAAAALVGMTGCSTVQVANQADFNGQDVVTSGKATNHVSAATHGLYFLKWGLITGSGENIGMPTLLKNTVCPEYLAQMVTKKSKDLGGSRVADLTTSSTSVGFLFQYKYAFASGTVVK